MATLTATNQRVQFYLDFSTKKPSTGAKYKRLNALKASLEERNIMLDEILPPKQLAVVDRIIYLTSGTGIAKVGADNLAEKCDVSKRTVTNAVKALKETGEYIVARLIKTRGGAGKYIFVDKKHENFRDIMREVFLLSDYKFAQLNAEEFAEQKSDKFVETVRLEEEKSSSNFNNFFIKQEKDIYISDSAKVIKKVIIKAIEEKTIPSREYVEEYATNSLQIAFYDVLEQMDYPKPIDEVKHILALRIGSDCDMKKFVKAKDIVHSIAIRISEGYCFNNVIAAFTTALEKSKSYNIIKAQAKQTYPKRRVKFYNWLEERE